MKTVKSHRPLSLNHMVYKRLEFKLEKKKSRRSIYSKINRANEIRTAHVTI